MWLRKLLQTSDDYVLMLSRVILGIVFVAHGAQKAFGWFGGPGFEPTVRTFSQGLGIPVFFAVLAILAEFLGGLGLLVGLSSRIAAFGIAVNMLVAIFLVHAQNGLFMNWSGNQRGEGFEYHLLALSLTLLIVVRGAGAWSLDRLLEGWLAGGRTLHIHMEPAPSR
jgi:putative oxidoreductase